MSQKERKNAFLLVLEISSYRLIDGLFIISTTSATQRQRVGAKMRKDSAVSIIYLFHRSSLHDHTFSFVSSVRNIVNKLNSLHSF